MDINEEIKNLTEAYANLLEDKDARGGAQKEVNKITRTKKDKNGEPVEVVSVADELFPYKGTAKEQYNQKILAKINDMIEGTATLDDLIQLVRSKQAKPVKEGFEGAIEILEEIINEVSNKTVERALNKAGDKVDLSTMGIIPPEKKYVEQYKRLQNLANKRAEKHGEKVEQDPDTGWHKHVKEGLQETLNQIMAVTEEIILERNKENRA